MPPRPGAPRRPIPKHAPTLELDVTELAPGGFGVSHVTHEGVRRAVFTSRTAPGDKVRASVDFTQRPARATTLALLAPSPDRRAPAEIPCRHLETCGACDFMHLTPTAQVRAHESFVRAHLPAAYRDTPITTHAPQSSPSPQSPSTAPSPSASTRTRARARVHVLARPHKSPAVGMFARSTNLPVAVDTCAILEPALDRARIALAELLQGARGEGEAHLAMGRTATSARAPVVFLEWRGDPLPGAVYARAEAAVRDGHLAGLSLSGAIVGRPAPVADGADGADLVLPLGGFSQAQDATNADLARAVAEEAMGLLGDAPTEKKTLVELYAGSGNLTVLLARALEARSDSVRLVAVETMEPACAAARENLTSRGLSARVVHANADGYALPEGTRVVVLDPPRTGARAVCEALVQSKVHGVVMVSCDPSTLGRDLATLAPRYDLVRLSTFEMFPETSHVETLAVLRAKKKK